MQNRRRYLVHCVTDNVKQLDELSGHGLTIVHVFVPHVKAAAERIIAFDFVIIFITSWSFQDTQSIPLQLHLYTIL